MNKINFMLGIHNHQPVGNFFGVFRQAYNDCYLPFVKILEKHPKIRVSLHYTGPLLEWIETNHPEYFDKLRNLLARNQIEIMGGGFYEPLLPVVPFRDALGQLKMMQDYIKDKFGVTPQGMWLAERVWEPGLPSVIAKGGLKYVTIDDTHFYYAGFKSDDMFGYYITENQGLDTAVFPIDKELRYRIPFKVASETINYLKDLARKYPGRGVTLADDGEKFGVWPGTHKWVYKDGYLENLFGLLSENSDWINMPTFSEYLISHPASGKIYLPTASYDEMMEWSLPAESQSEFEWIVNEFKEKNQYNKLRPYLRGGFWRNFLVKYPESNEMYSKMIHVSEKVNKSKNQSAVRELYKSQCNCAYWHGLFGGLYLNYLRHAIYDHLIGAENLLGSKKLEIERKDYDFDGEEEILVSSPELNLYLSPANGGQIIELDYKPKQFNLSNTLTRRKEAYHHKIENNSNSEINTQPASIHDMAGVKEEGLGDILFYDWYKRNSLIDHILDENTTLENFSKCLYGENGDFVNQPYTVNKCSKKSIVLSRQGTLCEDCQKPTVKESFFGIQKAIKVKSNSEIEIDYELSNANKDILNVWFGVEFNFTLLAGNDKQRYYTIPEKGISDESMNTTRQLDGVTETGLVDEYNKFKTLLTWSIPSVLWRFPIETVSRSESGLERTYQGSCIMPSWKFSFKPEEKVSINLIIKLKEI